MHSYTAQNFNSIHTSITMALVFESLWSIRDLYFKNQSNKKYETEQGQEPIPWKEKLYNYKIITNRTNSSISELSSIHWSVTDNPYADMKFKRTKGKKKNCQKQI